MEERRAAPRVKPADDCIVVHEQLVGNIKNISSSGLYCTCIQECDCVENSHRNIDILCGEGSFLVQGLRVKIVDMERISGKFLRDLEIKKCRMQFEDLRAEQAFAIETILSGACLQ
jgi:hypothetical protein